MKNIIDRIFHPFLSRFPPSILPLCLRLFSIFYLFLQSHKLEQVNISRYVSRSTKAIKGRNYKKQNYIRLRCSYYRWLQLEIVCQREKINVLKKMYNWRCRLIRLRLNLNWLPFPILIFFIYLRQFRRNGIAMT